MASKIDQQAQPESERFSQLFQGFSKLDRDERLRRLVEMGALSFEDVRFLRGGAQVPLELAEKFIENVLGFFQMPLGVATNFEIDGKPYVIPMAVEETSIIAAASKTAKWVREHGRITTEMIGKEIIGQIQIAKVNDYARVVETVKANEPSWVEAANRDVASGLVRRGGGVKRIEVRRIDRGDGGDMAVIHVYADQVCEYLKNPVEASTGEKVTMCILSNLVDSRLTRAKVEMVGLDAELMERIEEASLFAQQDPYRAATNNKGVLNGIDPILIATGNDWRAVEAGVHAYATQTGQYRSITRWKRAGNVLTGVFEAPVVLGVVGGVTTLHPTAKMCLKMLNVASAEELSRVCASVGLVQNLGALRALTTVGIIEGHMKLHIKNLTLGAGANEREMPYVVKRLEEILSLHKRISLSNAIEVLKELRAQRAREHS
jgi:hydroxymethylglutaryl-CoA reductase